MRQHPALANGPIYLDYNGTTPIDPAVLGAMTPYLATHFGNPSSAHAYGASARAGLDLARAQIADLVHARTGRIVFTGSGSEADALAIRGSVLAHPRAQAGLALADGPSGRPRPHVITQATEHPAVLAACADLVELHGVDLTILPVDATGRVNPADVADAITDHTVLVTIMHANNETGTTQPIADIAAVTHERGALMHCDAAQAIGKVAVDVDELGVDLLTIVGHKMYAPKGVGALYVRDGLALRPLVGGGGQEYGLRAGTENVPYAVALGHAATLAVSALAAGETARLTGLRDRLEQRLHSVLRGRSHLNGHPHDRLPNTLNIRIEGTSALALLAAMPELACSAGSACHAGQDVPSPVLSAMGIPPSEALTAIRLSLGRWTTIDEVDRAAEQIARSRTSDRATTR